MSFVTTMVGKISDTVTKVARLDAATHTMQTIDHTHHEVHGGSHFTFSAADGDLDAIEVMDYIVTTPDTTKWAHMVIRASGALHTRFELYEDTTHTTNAAQTAYNNNRNSATAATVTVHTSNDDGADGTMIFEDEFGVDTGGGDSRGDQEWVLKQNTKYLVRIDSLTDNNVVSLVLSWYEHTDKD